MEFDPKRMTPDVALQELAAIERTLHATGAVDVETSLIAQLRAELLSGHANPDEVIAKARRLVDARSNYH